MLSGYRLSFIALVTLLGWSPRTAQAQDDGCIFSARKHNIFQNILVGDEMFGTNFEFEGNHYLVLPAPMLSSQYSGTVYKYSGGNFTVHQYLVSEKDSSLHFTHLRVNDDLFLFQCGSTYISSFRWFNGTFRLHQEYNNSLVYQDGLCRAFNVGNESYLLSVNGYALLGIYDVVLMRLNDAGLLGFFSYYDWTGLAAAATDCNVFWRGSDLFAAISKEGHSAKLTLLKWSNLSRSFSFFQELPTSYAVYQSAVTTFAGTTYLVAPSEDSGAMMYVWNETGFVLHPWLLGASFGASAVFFSAYGGTYLAFGQNDHVAAWSVQILALNATGNLSISQQISTSWMSQYYLDVMRVRDGGQEQLFLIMAEGGHPALYALVNACPTPPPPPSMGFFTLYNIIFLSLGGAALLILLAVFAAYRMVKRQSQYEALADSTTLN